MKPVITRCWSGTHKAWGWAVTSGWTTVWGASICGAWSEFQKMKAINSYYTDKQSHGQPQGMPR